MTASLEIPAGKLDVPGEAPLACAQRELAEEIGKQAGRWTEIEAFYTSPGFSDERVWVFLATDLADADGGARPDEDERIEIVPWPLDDLDGALAESEDSKTLIALLWLAALARAWRPGHRLTARAQPQETPPRWANTAAHGHRRGIPRPAPAHRPDAGVPGRPGARARPVAQHAGGLPLRPAAVRGVPGPPRPRPARGRTERPVGVRVRAGRRARRQAAGGARHAAAQDRVPALVLPPPAPRADHRPRSHRRAAPAPLTGAPAQGADPRRGQPPAGPAARDRAGGAARPGAARDHVRLRPACERGDHARAVRDRPRGRDAAGPRQGLQGAARADRLQGGGRR